MDIKTVKEGLRQCIQPEMNVKCFRCLYEPQCEEGEFTIIKSDALEVIENLEKAIAEKQKRIENMEKIIEDQQERIDIMSEGGWISVKDRLPEQRIGVLVYCPEYNNVFAGELNDYLKKGQWYFFDDEIKHPIEEEVTHWMPMPKPPEEGVPE